MMKVTLTGASSADATVDRTTERGVTEKAVRNKATTAPNMYRQRPTFVISSSLHRPENLTAAQQSSLATADIVVHHPPQTQGPSDFDFLRFFARIANDALTRADSRKARPAACYDYYKLKK